MRFGVFDFELCCVAFQSSDTSRARVPHDFDGNFDDPNRSKILLTWELSL